LRSIPRVRLPRKTEIGSLGILGGTFDPIHLGHLICAEQLREVLCLDLVLFVPCSSPPHKPGFRPASAIHRMAMVEIALGGFEGFAASNIEIRKGGISYTVDTVTYLRKHYGQEVDLWLLMGMDTYLEVPTWKQPDRIAAECLFGVACRPGYSRKVARGFPGARSEFIDITAVDISSTDIRNRLKLGRSIRFLVPDAVADYIKVKKPYSAKPKKRQSRHRR
jgi:nicotinate-nucleotide adenylyltransferase